LNDENNDRTRSDKLNDEDAAGNTAADETTSRPVVDGMASVGGTGAA
jgi:hypothetical protein